MFKNAFFIALFALISWGSYQLSYPSHTQPDLFYDGLFMENVIKHVNKMTKGPRAVGEYYHDDVQRYLTKELSELGMQVSKQKTTSYNPKNKTGAPIRNIIAKYPGTDPTGKDLLLLAHYDAAKFSGKGAGDDASGVAIILETVNSLLRNPIKPVNDLVVLFTDAEEIGLLGAQAFINEQLKYHDIGLIINLEARGTNGPSMMWPETVGGNRAMIEGFAAANVPMPMTTSLHYEIYKMLPNDTDLTPFNQMAQINGFNFAFIDNHFNYHTQLDSIENLSLNTLAHQTIQMNSMVKYFSSANLSQLKTEDSLVYFTLPTLGLISYSTSFSWLVFTLSLVLFIWLTVVAYKKQLFSAKSLVTGTGTLLVAAVLAYGWCWMALYLIHLLRPEYQDILQGFPYLGHQIMTALLIGSAVLVFAVFAYNKTQQTTNKSIVHILLWLILLLPLNYYLPGSGLLIWPVLFSIVLLAIQIYLPKLAEPAAPVFATAGFLLLGTLLINFPIALGIKALPITAVLLALIIALYLPVINSVKKPGTTVMLFTLPLIYLGFQFFQHPRFSQTQPHPTSLTYLYDSDTGKGHYFNFDTYDSGWNEDLFTTTASHKVKNAFSDKYHKPVRNLNSTETPVVLNQIDITASKPLKQLDNLSLNFELKAHGNTELIEIYTNVPLTIHKLSVEGRNAILQQAMQLNAGDKILQYHFDGKKQIDLSLTIAQGQTIEWQIQSHSFDLLEHPEFDIKARPDYQIRKPFIKSDNTITVQSFSFGND